jgi:protein-disulfide isomerase
MRLLLVLVAGWVAVVPSVLAADGITSEQANQILVELRAIRQLLERQNASANAQVGGAAQPPSYQKVSIPMPPDAASLGSMSAPLVMIEFTDYQCPFCRRHHETTFEELRKKYVATGKLRYVSRDFPLDFHQNAVKAAFAARCAGEQGKFWEMRDAMIEHNDNLKPEELTQYAVKLALDADVLNRCIDSGRYKSAVEQDQNDGKSAGVSGTPSFVLGRLREGRVEGIQIVGAQPFSTFESQIEPLLQGR